YEWNGLSVGAGIGVGRFEQDVFGGARRKDEIETLKCKEWGWWFVLFCKEYGWEHQAWLDKNPTLQASSNDTDWSAFGTVQVGYDRLIQNRFLLGAFADLDFYNDSHASFSSEKKKNWLTGDVEREHSWTIGG